MHLWVYSRNQMPEQLVTDSAKKKQESKVKVMLITFLEVLARGPDNQTQNFLRDSKGHALLSRQEVTRFVAGQIVAASSWWCTCAQCPEYWAVPSQEEPHHTGTISHLTLLHWPLSFSSSSSGLSKWPVLKV